MTSTRLGIFSTLSSKASEDLTHIQSRTRLQLVGLLVAIPINASVISLIFSVMITKAITIAIIVSSVACIYCLHQFKRKSSSAQQHHSNTFSKSMEEALGIKKGESKSQETDAR
ncbi:hypothetical protein AB4254_08755 [Vibrio breoganii]